jgi:hypothetical protein
MGSESIDQNLVNQYQNTMIILSQQKQSRLEGTTIPPLDQQGENLYWERIGASEAEDIVSRHADTPNIEVDHSRRKSTATPKVWATLLDKMDKVRMLVDPTNYYNIIARAAMMRAKDRVIIAALEGSAWSGKAGTTEVALPSGQKIATGSVGLTLAKCLTAKEMMDGAEVDEEAPRFIVVSTQQITNMLNTTEVKSADYNSVKALAQGQINDFLGFKWIRTQLLTKSSTTRYCYAYAKGAVGFGVLEALTARIDIRVDKNMAIQVYNSQDMGATRVEDEQVVQIACTES